MPVPGGGALMKVGATGAGRIRMATICVAMGGTPLLAVMVVVNVPAVVGVPEICPFVPMESPPGNPVAANFGAGVPIAVQVKAYETPTVPEVGVPLVMVGDAGAGLMTMEKLCVAFGDTPLVATTDPGKVPAVVGVPEICPLVLMVKPVGRPVAVNRGVGDPVATQVWLNETPTVPVVGMAPLVKVGAISTGAAGTHVTFILEKLAPWLA